MPIKRRKCRNAIDIPITLVRPERERPLDRRINVESATTILFHINFCNRLQRSEYRNSLYARVVDYWKACDGKESLSAKANNNAFWHFYRLHCNQEDISGFQSITTSLKLTQDSVSAT